MSTDPRVETLQLLRSIDASLKVLVSRSAAQATAAIASDEELNGRYGDPLVKFTPRDWQGDNFVGLPMSNCPPEFLELLAKSFDYFARKADEKGELTGKGKPAGDFKRKDAALARGWAARNRLIAPMMPTQHHVDGFSSETDSADDAVGEDDIRW